MLAALKHYETANIPMCTARWGLSNGNYCINMVWGHVLRKSEMLQSAKPSNIDQINEKSNLINFMQTLQIFYGYVANECAT